MVTAAPPTLARHAPLVAGAPLAPDRFAEVRRRMVFEHCKWDPQVEDVNVLAPFPLVLGADVWADLAQLAESLADDLRDDLRDDVCDDVRDDVRDDAREAGPRLWRRLRACAWASLALWAATTVAGAALVGIA